MLHNIPGVLVVAAGVVLSMPSLGWWALIIFGASLTAALAFDRRAYRAVIRWTRRR